LAQGLFALVEFFLSPAPLACFCDGNHGRNGTRHGPADLRSWILPLGAWPLWSGTHDMNSLRLPSPGIALPSPGAFVCITGQLGRLELRHKIEGLVKPMTAEFSRVDVGLAMDDEAGSSMRFVNSDAKSSDSSDLVLSDVERELLAAGATSVLVQFPHHNVSAQLNQTFLRNIEKREMTWAQREALAVGHVRQFESLAACSSIFDRLLQPPAIIARIRDDALIANMNITGLWHTLQGYRDAGEPKVILTQECPTWFGINDKGAVVPGAAASDYFSGLIEDYHKRLTNDIFVNNPETYFMSVRKARGNLSLKTTPMFRLMPSRLQMQNGCLRFMPRKSLSACEKAMTTEILVNGAPCCKK